MEEAILRAAQQGATASSVMSTPVPRTTVEGAGGAVQHVLHHHPQPLHHHHLQHPQQQHHHPTSPTIQPSHPPSHNLRNPSDSESYFNALLTRPSILSPRGAVGLLALTARCFASEDEADKATPIQCSLYLQAVAAHGDELVDASKTVVGGGREAVSAVASGGSTAGAVAAATASSTSAADQRFVADIIQAAGCAAVKCNNRDDVRKSGIIPVLIRLAEVVSVVISDPSSGSAVPPISVDGGDAVAGEGGSLFAFESGKLSSFGEENNILKRRVVRGGGGGGFGLLTPAHAEVIQCCLSAGQYNVATQFASCHPVTAVSLLCHVGVEQYLRYFYLLGIAHCGDGDYERAVEVWGLCITVPSQIISAITIAARKKMLLVSCLCPRYANAVKPRSSATSFAASEMDGGNREGRFSSSSSADASGSGGGMVMSGSAGGRFSDLSSLESGGGGGSMVKPTNGPPGLMSWPWALPGCASSSVLQFFNSAGWGIKEYDRLVSSFLRGDVNQFCALRKDMERMLVEDGNIGLADLLRDEIGLRAVRHLANIYEAISLRKMEDKIAVRYLPEGSRWRRSPDENLESWTFRIIQAAAVADVSGRSTFAKIDQEEGVVFFHPFPSIDDGDNDDDGEIEGRGWSNLTSSSSCSGTSDDLYRRMGQIIALADRVKNLDISLSTSQKYQSIVNKDSSKLRPASSKSASGGRVGGGAVSSVGVGPRAVADFEQRGAYPEYHGM